MSLFKSVPKGCTKLGKAIGICHKTVKKYLSELIYEGVYDENENLLNSRDFPYWEQVRIKREKQTQKIIEDFREWITQCEFSALARPNYYTRTMEWVRNLKEPEEVKAYVWRKVISGLLRSHEMQEEIKPELIYVKL